MRTQMTILLIGLLAVTTGCSKEDESRSPVGGGDRSEVLGDTEGIEGTWYMASKRGGSAGVNEYYAIGTIAWTFDGKCLTIVDRSGKGGGLAGAHSYSTFNKGGKRFLIIDGDESGMFYVRNGTLTIDENERSVGWGADGFFMTFEK